MEIVRIILQSIRRLVSECRFLCRQNYTSTVYLQQLNKKNAQDHVLILDTVQVTGRASGFGAGSSDL